MRLSELINEINSLVQKFQTSLSYNEYKEFIVDFADLLDKLIRDYGKALIFIQERGDKPPFWYKLNLPLWSIQQKDFRNLKNSGKIWVLDHRGSRFLLPLVRVSRITTISTARKEGIALEICGKRKKQKGRR